MGNVWVYDILPVQRQEGVSPLKLNQQALRQLSETWRITIFDFGCGMATRQEAFKSPVSMTNMEAEHTNDNYDHFWADGSHGNMSY